MIDALVAQCELEAVVINATWLHCAPHKIGIETISKSDPGWIVNKYEVAI